MRLFIFYFIYIIGKGERREGLIYVCVGEKEIELSNFKLNILSYSNYFVCTQSIATGENVCRNGIFHYI